MIGEHIFLDDQGGKNMQVISKDVSPTIMMNAGKGHSLIVVKQNKNVEAFTQNTRDEVRLLGEVSGCLGAQSGMKQQTYLMITTKNDRE